LWRDDDLALLNISSKIIGSALLHERMGGEIKSLASFPSQNPNPVLRLDKDGAIILANEASQALLQDWGCKVGGYAPKFWRDLVTETLTSESRRTIDVELGDRVFLFFVMPVKEASYVNFYGRDITDRKQMEEELRRRSAHLEELVENRTEEIKKLNESMSQRLIQKIRQIDNMSGVRDEVRKSPDISTALGLILDAVLNDLEMDTGAVLIVKRKENAVKLRGFKSGMEGMKLDDEYSLGVGFAELEALNENKNISKIVGRDETTILRTPSVHCAPIHFGKEVYGILACGSRKNLTLDGSDLTVLGLYSDLASTVFETRSLAITPVKEIGSIAEKRFDLESGCSYLAKNDIQKAFEAFTDNVLGGFDGLCITREFPSKVRRKFGLEKTPIVWLTGEKVEGQTTINSLQDLSVLIGNFLEKVDHGVVMLDGFEYLITNNGFDSFIRFLQMTRSRFEQRGAVFIAPLLEEALDAKQVKLIEREMKLLISK